MTDYYNLSWPTRVGGRELVEQQNGEAPTNASSDGNTLVRQGDTGEMARRKHQKPKENSAHH